MENLLEILSQLLKNHLVTLPILAYPITFIAGVLVSFTPCVYPLIPIVIGYIVGKADKSRPKAFLLVLFYVIGMAITYSGLGIFAALSGGLFGEIQTHPITYFVVANLFILFGLSLLEVWVLPIPAFLRRARPHPERSGLLGALGMGLASGFIFAPCTIGVLGVLLTYVASQQNLFLGATLLFTFALGAGSFLFLLGIFTGILSALPKAGRWTQYIQKALGLGAILLGEYFLIQTGRY